jgi:hypothetical protein
MALEQYQFLDPEVMELQERMVLLVMVELQAQRET